jgi:hypothetical protein
MAWRAQRLDSPRANTVLATYRRWCRAPEPGTYQLVVGSVGYANCSHLTTQFFIDVGSQYSARDLVGLKE